MLELLALLVAIGACVAALAYAEHERRPPRARRFEVALRRSHVVVAGRRNRRRWRWTVHPTYLPPASLGGFSALATSGRARTYPGALFAASRARAAIEVELDADRHEFLNLLTDAARDGTTFGFADDADRPA